MRTVPVRSAAEARALAEQKLRDTLQTLAEVRNEIAATRTELGLTRAELCGTREEVAGTREVMASIRSAAPPQATTRVRPKLRDFLGVLVATGIWVAVLVVLAIVGAR